MPLQDCSNNWQNSNILISSLERSCMRSKRKWWEEKSDKGLKTGTLRDRQQTKRETSQEWIKTRRVSFPPFFSFFPFFLLFALFAHTTSDSPLLLQPSLFSDSFHPLTSGSPHFIISVSLRPLPFLYLRALFPPLLRPASSPSFLSHPFISVFLPPRSPSSPSSLPMANCCC